MGTFDSPSSQPQNENPAPPKKLIKVRSWMRSPAFGFWVDELHSFPAHGGAEINIRLFGHTLVFYLAVGFYED